MNSNRGNHNNQSPFSYAVGVFDELNQRAENYHSHRGGYKLNESGTHILPHKQHNADSRQEKAQALDFKRYAFESERGYREVYPLNRHQSRANVHRVKDGREPIFLKVLRAVTETSLYSHKDVKKSYQYHKLVRLHSGLVADL